MAQRAPAHLVWLDVANNNFTGTSLAQAANAASGGGQPVLIVSKGARSCRDRAARLCPACPAAGRLGGATARLPIVPVSSWEGGRCRM